MFFLTALSVWLVWVYSVEIDSDSSLHECKNRFWWCILLPKSNCHHRLLCGQVLFTHKAAHFLLVMNVAHLGDFLTWMLFFSPAEELHSLSWTSQGKKATFLFLFRLACKLVFMFAQLDLRSQTKNIWGLRVTGHYRNLWNFWCLPNHAWAFSAPRSSGNTENLHSPAEWIHLCHLSSCKRRPFPLQSSTCLNWLQVVSTPIRRSTTKDSWWHQITAHEGTGLRDKARQELRVWKLRKSLLTHQKKAVENGKTLFVQLLIYKTLNGEELRYWKESRS